jgi:hypothetical protein
MIRAKPNLTVASASTPMNAHNSRITHKPLDGLSSEAMPEGADGMVKMIRRRGVSGGSFGFRQFQFTHWA